MDKHFWTKVFISKQSLTEFYGPHDYEILESLLDFGVFVSKDSKRFTIWMKLGNNRYIESEVVWKTFDENLKTTDFSGVKWKRLISQTQPMNQEKTIPTAKSLSDFRKSRHTFFLYFMYALEYECECVLTSLLLELWRQPFISIEDLA